MIQSQIIKISEYTGLDLANVRILTCSLLSYPFSAIFKRLPDNNYTLRNTYIVLVSGFYIFAILELYSGLTSLLLCSLGSYFITRYLKTSTMPWANFVFLMVFLSYHHIHEQFFQVYDTTVIDITGALMVMVMKLSAFGWSIHDGRQPKELLTSYTKSRVIKKHPNILPFLGYSFFYASLLTGPAFDYADYERFLQNTLFEDVPESRRPGKRKRRIPRSGRVSLLTLLKGFGWAFLFVKVPNYITYDYMFTTEFVYHNFFYKVFYMWGMGFFYRLKYYAIWTIAEGACILCGIGYNGYDPVHDKFKWDRVQNIAPWRFETGMNVHICLESWNMNTNKWLKNFVYLRLAKKGKRPGFKSTVATFITSAFWHGTRPGYYLTFLIGAFIQTVGKIFRRNIRPIFIDKDGNKSKFKPLYDIVSYVITQLTFGYVVQPFVVLDFKNSLYLWSTVNYWVVSSIALTLLAFRGPYSKQVTAFFTKYHMSADEHSHKPKSLNLEESERVVKALNSYMTKERDLVHSPSLGVPSLEDLENLQGEDIDEELRELKATWDSFKASGGQNDIDGLRNAYDNFVKEINEIFESHSKSSQAKVKVKTS